MPRQQGDIGGRNRGVQLVAQTGAIVELVKAGLGVAVLARWAVEPFVKAGTLRALRLTRGCDRRRWSAAVLKDMADVGYVREFIDLFARHSPVHRAAGLTAEE